jgi:tRNA C32,U32 (ribose-2'-O)-methylase TrmJ
MNLGQAVALCLYELARDAKEAVTRTGGKCLSRPQQPKMNKSPRLLLDALRRKRLHPTARIAASTEEKVRRLVRSLKISKKDAPVLLGMLRQILWKLE